MRSPGERTIFRLYLEHGTVRRVKEEADRLSLTTKLRPGEGGRMRGGKPFSRGSLYRLLGNPLYVGRIPHKAEIYEGQHPAIVDPEIWETVQTRLAGNTRKRSTGTRASKPSPLRGKLFDEAGILSLLNIHPHAAGPLISSVVDDRQAALRQV